MISRVAESCFWLFRYMERADSLARLLRVHSGMVLDAALPPSRTWRPLLIVLGEEPAFVEKFGQKAAEDGDAVLEHLTWNRESAVSIVSSLAMAREGARTIRETVSFEMWEALNSTWIWLTRGAGRRLYNREPAAFYEEVTRRCHQFLGACQNTMLHEEPFDFMRLGFNLEKVDQTARILDIQHHALGPANPSRPESAVETAEWIAILRACAAYEPFFKKRSAPLAGPGVAAFLLFEPAFPGSITHALDRAQNFLRRINAAGPTGGKEARRSQTLLNSIQEDLAAATIDSILAEGIHDFLTSIVERAGKVSVAIREDYFAVRFVARPPTEDAPLPQDA